MGDHTSRSTGWQLDQTAPEAYEQYLVPPIFAPWADRLLDTANVREGDRVLDVACGTGVVARHAASRVGNSGSVVGLDINEGMLTVAEETATDSQPSIEWRQGDATDLPFSEGTYDVALCQQSLQFFDDAPAGIREMHRVLVSDGRMALSVWRPLDYQPGYVVLAEALERHISGEAGTMMRSPFPEWDGDYLRKHAREAGFGDVSVTIEIVDARYPSVEEFVRREAASSPLAEQISAVEQEIRDELLHEVGDALGEYTNNDGIVFPMESYVLTASR